MLAVWGQGRETAPVHSSTYLTKAKLSGFRWGFSWGCASPPSQVFRSGTCSLETCLSLPTGRPLGWIQNYRAKGQILFCLALKRGTKCRLMETNDGRRKCLNVLKSERNPAARWSDSGSQGHRIGRT